MRQWVISDDKVEDRMRWHSLIELGAYGGLCEKYGEIKLVVLNTYLSYKFKHDCDILVNNVLITPSFETRFLGVIMDKKLEQFFITVKTLL